MLKPGLSEFQISIIVSALCGLLQCSEAATSSLEHLRFPKVRLRKGRLSRYSGHRMAVEKLLLLLLAGTFIQAG